MERTSKKKGAAKKAPQTETKTANVQTMIEPSLEEHYRRYLKARGQKGFIADRSQDIRRLIINELVKEGVIEAGQY